MQGFTWNIDPVLFRLGPFQLRYYGVCFAVTILLGFVLLGKRLRERGYPIDIATRFLIAELIGLIVGARLAHCFFYQPSHYLAHPLAILKVWEGGVASHGAAVGLIVAAVYFSKSRKIPLFTLTDALTFAAALGAGCVRIGNFFNSEIIGSVTTMPWGVRFLRRDAALRHPSQIYEAIGGFVILAALLALNRKREDMKPGFLTGVFVAGYFTFRFFIEFVKDYQVFTSSPLTMGQCLSIPFIVLGVVILITRYGSNRTR